MGFRHISKDIKDRALWLRSEGYITDDICEILGISECSIRRWKNTLDEHGTVIPPSNLLQGRPRTLNSDQCNDLFTMLEDTPELYLDEIQDWVALSHDVSMLKSALHALIRDAGSTYKMLCKAAAECDEEARAIFKTFISEHLTADMVVTVDETSKDDRTIFRRWGRAPHG
ncbi:hypothetical protein FIBSPDRAFT_677304, partial [Athelia psychrophila]